MELVEIPSSVLALTRLSSAEISHLALFIVAWYPCPDVTTTLCTYHTVPISQYLSELTRILSRLIPIFIDWSEPRANETVSLALRMLPATVPVKDQLGYLL